MTTSRYPWLFPCVAVMAPPVLAVAAIWYCSRYDPSAQLSVDSNSANREAAGSDRRGEFISVTKPRQPGTRPSPHTLSPERRRLLQADLSIQGDQSEVGHAMAALNRSSQVFDEKCRGTQLSAVAASYRRGDGAYTFRGQQYNAPEQMGTLGLEWILWLHEQAGIPLAVVHKFLLDFPKAACMVDPIAVPVATRLQESAKSPKQAEDLARSHDTPTTERSWFSGDPSGLPGERPYEEALRLDEKTARQALAFPRYAVRRDHDVVFSKARQLDKEAAAVLATHRHGLSFPSLTTLSVDVAASLAKHRGGPSSTGAGLDDGLVFGGLTTLPPNVASAIARRDSGCLEFGSSETPLKDLSHDVATALSQYNGRMLTLHVSRMSKEAQDTLAGCQGLLQLNPGDGELSVATESTNRGLEQLASPALAEKLCNDCLSPDTLTVECRALSPAALSALGEHAAGRDVVFSCMEAVPDDVVAAYLKWKGGIQFTRLRRISTKAVQMLSSENGSP